MMSDSGTPALFMFVLVAFVSGHYEPGSEILFQCCGGCRFFFDRLGRLELPAMLRMNRPGAMEFHRRTGKHLCLVNDNGLLLMGVVER